MASGNSIFTLKQQNSIAPATIYGTVDFIPDGSAPVINIPVLDFDGTTSEHTDWLVTLPSHYASTTGLTFRYLYAMDGSDVDLVDMEFRVLPITDNLILSGDLGMDGQTPVSIQDTPIVTVTANKAAYSPTGALAKASFGTALAGAVLLIRATRDVAAAANGDDLQLLEVLVSET